MTDVVIPPAVPDLVDLFKLKPRDGTTELLLDDRRKRSFSTKPNRTDALFRLKVVVTARNAKSVTRVVEFRASPEKWFHEVGEGEEPREFYDVAFVNLIDDLVKGNDGLTSSGEPE